MCVFEKNCMTSKIVFSTYAFAAIKRERKQNKARLLYRNIKCISVISSVALSFAQYASQNGMPIKHAMTT